MNRYINDIYDGYEYLSVVIRQFIRAEETGDKHVCIETAKDLIWRLECLAKQAKAMLGALVNIDDSSCEYAEDN